MVEIITSDMFSGDAGDLLNLVKDLVSTLVYKTELTVKDEVDTDTEYSAVLVCPDNYRAIKISATYDGTATSATYAVSEGYYTTEFIQGSGNSRSYYTRPSYPNKWFELYLLNDGDCFTFVVSGPSSTSGYNYNDAVSNFVKLESESGIVHYSINAWSATKTEKLFTSTNNKPIIRANNTNASILFPLQSNSYVYMGEMIDTEVIAFPWVLYVDSNAINLGIPTVGGKKVYKILNRHTESTYFPAYEEVTIGDKRFVNIGQNLIIESD